MAEEEQDFSKLSLEDRCSHKNWKARVSAYEELTKVFPRIDDDKEWGKYAGWVRKFPTDSNAAAQEKALEVVVLFFEFAVVNQAGRIVTEIMSGIVSKCITASKAKSKEMANSIALMCVEVEKFEAVQEELMKGMEQKNPKVVAGCIAILTEILKAFGPKVINLKPLLKKLPGMTEDRDKTVRDETKKLMVELYRWLGPAFKPQLNAVKELIVKDVEAELEKCKDKPVQTRYLRSQQARKEREAAEEGNEDEADGDAPDEEAAPDIDPFDLLDPVDILAKLPKDFYEKCEAKKWQDRKEAMESLDSLITANPKLEPGDYSDCVRNLRKMVGKDSNVLVVALAAKCIAGLANGLKKKFSPYAAHCISTILEKFKEKKPQVVTALREAIDNCFVATSLETIQEDVITALNGKNPQVKIETNTFLARTFAKTPLKIMSDKKLMKPYFTAIVANLNESDPLVRDSAAEAFGVAMKHLGEKAVTPLTADLEPIKLAKVKEFCDKAVITAPKEKVVKQAPPPKTAVSKPAPSKPAAAKPGAGTKKPAPGKKLPVKKDFDDDYGLEDPESASAAVTPEEVDDDGVTRVDISGFITEQLLNELADKKNWKTRDEALDKVRALITKHKHVTASLGDLPGALAQRLQDSNKNLANSTFLLCQNLAIALGRNAKRHTSTLAAAMLSGLGDSKPAVRVTVTACINAWADNGGVNEFFQGEMIADALKNGNPFLRSELFDWLSSRLPQMKSVNKDELNACIPHLFSGIEDRNADVRKAANEAVLPFMIHLGFEAMARQASRLKPASKSVIDAALAKAKPNLPAKPAAPAASAGTKGVRGGGGKIPQASSKTEVAKSSSKTRVIAKPRGSPPNKKPSVEETSSNVNLPENHMKSQRFSDEMKFKILKWNFTAPREEFTEQLKDLMTTAGFGKALLVNLFHHDFKMHLKAVDTLLEEFNQGPEGTLANLDLILKWSSIRFFDTNPSVLIRILDYLVQVFQVLGGQEYPLADIEANSFIPYLLLKIGDPKDTVRGSVHQIVQLLVYVYSPPHIFQYIMEGLKSKNARQRSECLDEIGYMIAAHGIGVIHPSPAVALKEVAKQIADRDNSVRNSALNALVQAYYIDQDINKLYRYVGQLSDKDQSYLDERIKRAMKNRPTIPVLATPLNMGSPEEPPVNQFATITKGSPSPNKNQQAMGNAPVLNQRRQQSETPYDDEAEVPDQYADQYTTGYGSRDTEVAVAPPPTKEFSYHFKNPSPIETPRESGLPEKYRINFDAIDRMYPDTGPMPPMRLLNTDISEFQEDIGYNLKNLKRGVVKPVVRPPPVEPVNFSPVVNQSIDLVVTQIGDATLRTSTEACIMLDSMVKDTETSTIMAGRVDTIISMVALQMRRQQPVILTENSEKLNDLNTFFKAAVGLLNAVFKGDFLPKRASKDSIREIIHHLLVLIIDDNLHRLRDANPLIKMVNVMVVRIIEKCDPNAVTCGLIRLLNESLTNSASQPSRLLDLVMKCQWKLLKQYNVWWENKEYNWDIPSILNEFYFFMKAHPFNSFSDKDITPLKTVKTILHALALHLGVEPLQYQLNAMHELRESEAGLYLQKLIQRELSKKLQPVQVKRDNPQFVPPDSTRSDVNDNGLLRAKNVNLPGSTADFLSSLPDPDTAPTVEAKAACYLQRLKMIRSRAGLTDTTSKPSINLGMDLSDGEESTI